MTINFYCQDNIFGIKKIKTQKDPNQAVTGIKVDMKQ